MINDPSKDRIYQNLLSQFRRIRSERNLTDDEYPELIAAAVQSIPCRDGGGLPPEYPADLLAENRGDCDDKSILIAGLLAREGYPVVLLKFGPEHRAMGIGSDAFPCTSTGHTYLEAMSPAYAGFPTSHLLILLDSEPLVILVSSGMNLYRRGNETSCIHNTSFRAQERAAELSSRLEKFLPSEKNSTGNFTVPEEHDRSAGIYRVV